MSFVPAWKDQDDNRFVVLAENQVFDSREAAVQFAFADLLFYIPLGWTPAGVLEIDLEDGQGILPHVPCDGPFRTKLAVFEGPVFEEFADTTQDGS